eukprot:6196033-Pleurochrysis_carterae.AAC.1
MPCEDGAFPTRSVTYAETQTGRARSFLRHKHVGLVSALAEARRVCCHTRRPWLRASEFRGHAAAALVPRREFRYALPSFSAEVLK